MTELRSKGLLTDERPTAVSLTQLQQIIEGRYQLDKDGIMQRGRINNVSEARCVFCFYAVRQLHHPAAEIARHLRIGPPAVSRAIRKSEKIVEGDQEPKEWMIKSLKQEQPTAFPH